MTRVGAKPILDVMKELNVLRLVDMRGNTDENLLGVLEFGEHYTTFSSFQPPFWLTPEALDPAIAASRMHKKKLLPRKTYASKPRFADEEAKESSSNQQVSRVKGGGGSRNMTPRSITSTKVTNTPRSVTSNSRTLGTRSAKDPRNFYKIPNYDKVQPRYLNDPRAVEPRSSSSPSVSKENGSFKSKRGGVSPRKEWPVASNARSLQRSTWPGSSERCLYYEQDGSRPTTASNISPRAIAPWEQEDAQRIMSPMVIDPPQEHVRIPAQVPSLWNNELFEVDTRENLSSCSDDYSRADNGRRRGLTGGYSRSRHASCTRSGCALAHIPRRPSSTGRGSKARPGNCRRRSRRSSRTPKVVSPPRPHARCTILQEVQQQKKNRNILLKASEEQPVFQQSKNPLSEDKKEVEWNNFVTEMTDTLLNLKGMYQSFRNFLPSMN